MNHTNTSRSSTYTMNKRGLQVNNTCLAVCPLVPGPANRKPIRPPGMTQHKGSILRLLAQPLRNWVGPHASRVPSSKHQNTEQAGWIGHQVTKETSRHSAPKVVLISAGSFQVAARSQMAVPFDWMQYCHWLSGLNRIQQHHDAEAPMA